MRILSKAASQSFVSEYLLAICFCASHVLTYVTCFYYFKHRARRIKVIFFHFSLHLLYVRFSFWNSIPLHGMRYLIFFLSYTCTYHTIRSLFFLLICTSFLFNHYLYRVLFHMFSQVFSRSSVSSKSRDYARGEAITSFLGASTVWNCVCMSCPSTRRADVPYTHASGRSSEAHRNPGPRCFSYPRSPGGWRRRAPGTVLSPGTFGSPGRFSRSCVSGFLPDKKPPVTTAVSHIVVVFPRIPLSRIPLSSPLRLAPAHCTYKRLLRADFAPRRRRRRLLSRFFLDPPVRRLA